MRREESRLKSEHRKRCEEEEAEQQKLLAKAKEDSDRYEAEVAKATKAGAVKDQEKNDG